MFSQISTLRSVPAETWAAIAAAVGAIAVVAKKLISRRKSPPKPDLITRAEFHHELTAIRDRIGASYIAIADKLDGNHKEVLAVIASQGATFESRIDQLESGFARVDERTRR